MAYEEKNTGCFIPEAQAEIEDASPKTHYWYCKPGFAWLIKRGISIPCGQRSVARDYLLSTCITAVIPRLGVTFEAGELS